FVRDPAARSRRIYSRPAAALYTCRCAGRRWYGVLSRSLCPLTGGAGVCPRVHPHYRCVYLRRYLRPAGADAGMADGRPCAGLLHDCTRHRGRRNRTTCGWEAVGLHPAVSLLALIAGGELFGITGALLASPVAGVIQAIVVSFWKEWRETHPEEFQEIKNQVADKVEKNVADRPTV